MIFYFSGTGNSYATACFLAEKLGDKVIDMAQALRNNETEYLLAKDEKVGFVFPIYAWAPPKAVLDFVNQLCLHSEKQPYIFGVCTCGGSAGNGMQSFKNVLKKNGMTLDSGYSVIMPDNYIVMFKVMSLEEQAEVLKAASVTMKWIALSVKESKQGFFRVKKGKGARIFTSVVNPLFQLGGMKTKPFLATSKCNSCGLCERVCTDGCIRLEDGQPRWTKKNCNMCLACINRCPQEAIQYGNKTKEKGRYIHPCWR